MKTKKKWASVFFFLFFCSYSFFRVSFAEEAPSNGLALPKGHPDISAQKEDEAKAASGPGVDSDLAFRFENSVREDKSLQAGSLRVHVKKVDNTNALPAPNMDIRLDTFENSVATGENKNHVSARTDGEGDHLFSFLSTGSDMAYRVSLTQGKATFSTEPFRLSPSFGMDVVLYIFPVVEDIEQSLVVTQMVTYAELKDERMQFEEAVTFFNFGTTAWFSDGFVFDLPRGYVAFQSEKNTGDLTTVELAGKGAKIRGTFGPGRHDLVWRYQLPYQNEGKLIFEIGTSPHMALARVIASQMKSLELHVDGFQGASSLTLEGGQRVLVSERRLSRRDQAFSSIKVTMKGLPTGTPFVKLVTLFSVLLMFGTCLWWVQYASYSAREEKKIWLNYVVPHKAALLMALDELEQAKKSGKIGPKTYEKETRKFKDRLAELFWQEKVKTL